MSLEWIREYYKVPAYEGVRVEFEYKRCNDTGTIIGANGPHLMVKIDGAGVQAYHPTWNLTYQQI